MISVSTTFFPGADLDVSPTDLIILSSDSVFFYVHTHKVLAASTNGFNSLLPPKEQGQPDGAGGILPLHDDSVVINVLLHTIYNMSAAHYAPTPEVVITAVESLEKYGLSVQTYLAPASPLSMLFLGTAPQAPIEFYATAGAYGLHHLAIPVSSFLLSYTLASLTDELAAKMGPLYVKRLFYLHLGRVEALKRLLLPPPQPHVPTANCDFAEQKKLTRAWALASAYLVWDMRPDLSTHAIEAALRPLSDYLACDQCKQLLRERINNLVAQWSIVKVRLTFLMAPILMALPPLAENCIIRAPSRGPTLPNASYMKTPALVFCISLSCNATPVLYFYLQTRTSLFCMYSIH
ncbi:hypothetical protein BJV78DRAFT_1130640 [Lactifluus subvellereus]|nr:hypothetical protein BJV78DRAFT_1130640 [Lactifluus subvellereus]